VKPFEAPEAPHRIITLLDTAVILLNPVVESRVAAMRDVLAQRLTDRPRLGVVPS
jgi:hypothetical protein